MRERELEAELEVACELVRELTEALKEGMAAQSEFGVSARERVLEIAVDRLGQAAGEDHVKTPDGMDCVTTSRPVPACSLCMGRNLAALAGRRRTGGQGRGGGGR